MRFRSSGVSITDILFPAARIGIGMVLLLSSLPKWMYPYEFLSQVYDYELTGPRLGVFTAVVVPAVELVIGACLIRGVFVEGASLGGILLFVVFTFVQVSALRRGLGISCGCFDITAADEGRVSYMTLIRTVLLLVICAILFFRVVVYGGHRKSVKVN